MEAIKPHYDVVVIGSGYGGGIAASRMARAGRSVCVLERGKEFQPGEYPDTELKAAEEFQVHLCDGKHIGDRTALFDDWRRRLCGFLGVPPGPSLGNGGVFLVV